MVENNCIAIRAHSCMSMALGRYQASTCKYKMFPDMQKLVRHYVSTNKNRFVLYGAWLINNSTPSLCSRILHLLQSPFSMERSLKCRM